MLSNTNQNPGIDRKYPSMLFNAADQFQSVSIGNDCGIDQHWDQFQNFDPIDRQWSAFGNDPASPETAVSWSAFDVAVVGMSWLKEVTGGVLIMEQGFYHIYYTLFQLI